MGDWEIKTFPVRSVEIMSTEVEIVQCSRLGKLLAQKGRGLLGIAGEDFVKTKTTGTLEEAKAKKAQKSMRQQRKVQGKGEKKQQEEDNRKVAVEERESEKKQQ